MKHPLSTFDGEYDSNGYEVFIRSVAREMKSQLFSFDVKNASYEESMKLDDILSFFFLSLSLHQTKNSTARPSSQRGNTYKRNCGIKHLKVK